METNNFFIRFKDDKLKKKLNESLVVGTKVMGNIASRIGERCWTLFHNFNGANLPDVSGSESAIQKSCSCPNITYEAIDNDSKHFKFNQNSSILFECAPREELYYGNNFIKYDFGNIFKSHLWPGNIPNEKIETTAVSDENIENTLKESSFAKFKNRDISACNFERKLFFTKPEADNSVHEIQSFNEILFFPNYKPMELISNSTSNSCFSSKNHEIPKENIVLLKHKNQNERIFSDANSNYEKSHSRALLSDITNNSRNDTICFKDEFDMFIESMKEVVFLNRTERNCDGRHTFFEENYTQASNNEIMQYAYLKKDFEQDRLYKNSISVLPMSQNVSTKFDCRKKDNIFVSVCDSLSDSEWQSNFIPLKMLYLTPFVYHFLNYLLTEKQTRLSRLKFLKSSMAESLDNRNDLKGRQCSKFKEMNNKPFLNSQNWYRNDTCHVQNGNVIEIAPDFDLDTSANYSIEKTFTIKQLDSMLLTGRENVKLTGKSVDFKQNRNSAEWKHSDVTERNIKINDEITDTPIYKKSRIEQNNTKQICAKTIFKKSEMPSPKKCTKNEEHCYTLKEPDTTLFHKNEVWVAADMENSFENFSPNQVLTTTDTDCSMRSILPFKTRSFKPVSESFVNENVNHAFEIGSEPSSSNYFITRVMDKEKKKLRVFSKHEQIFDKKGNSKFKASSRCEVQCNSMLLLDYKNLTNQPFENKTTNIFDDGNDNYEESTDISSTYSDSFDAEILKPCKVFLTKLDYCSQYKSFGLHNSEKRKSNYHELNYCHQNKKKKLFQDNSLNKTKQQSSSNSEDFTTATSMEEITCNATNSNSKSLESFKQISDCNECAKNNDKKKTSKKCTGRNFKRVHDQLEEIPKDKSKLDSSKPLKHESNAYFKTRNESDDLHQNEKTKLFLGNFWNKPKQQSSASSSEDFMTATSAEETTDNATKTDSYEHMTEKRDDKKPRKKRKSTNFERNPELAKNTLKKKSTRNLSNASKRKPRSHLKKRNQKERKNVISKPSVKVSSECMCIGKKQCQKCLKSCTSRKSYQNSKSYSLVSSRSDIFYSYDGKSHFKQGQTIKTKYKSYYPHKLDCRCEEINETFPLFKRKKSDLPSKLSGMSFFNPTDYLKNINMEILSSIIYNARLSSMKTKNEKGLRFQSDRKVKYNTDYRTIHNLMLASKKQSGSVTKIVIPGVSRSTVSQTATLDDLLLRSRYAEYKKILSSQELTSSFIDCPQGKELKIQKKCRRNRKFEAIERKLF